MLLYRGELSIAISDPRTLIERGAIAGRTTVNYDVFDGVVRGNQGVTGNIEEEETWKKEK